MTRQLKKAILASAVTAALGAGATVATADSIMFPYVVKGPSVTTLATIINRGDVPVLHYTWSFKTPVAGETEAQQNARNCTHFDNTRVTSKNDIVTFDAGRVYGDDNFVLFDDTGAGGSNTYDGRFGLADPTFIAVLMVDNNTHESGYDRYDQTLAGEAMVLEFSSGAAWGYSAYNPDTEDNYSFSAQHARHGEVLVDPEYTDTPWFYANPIDIVPLSGENANWVERLYVTPIDYGYGNQDELDLTTEIVFGERVGESEWLAYNRDEDEVSLRLKKQVTCVGRITMTAPGFFPETAITDELQNGGWTDVYVDKPSLPETDTRDETGQAIVQKLEFNVAGDGFGGIVNEAVWLMNNNVGNNDMPKAPESVAPAAPLE